jgi:hypothetical protein
MRSQLTFGSPLRQASVSASTFTVAPMRSSTADGWSSHAKPRSPTVITKVPTVGEFLHRWLEDTVAPNLAPLTYATYGSHVQNYIEPGLGALRLDRLRVADVQGGSIAWPHNANAARRERTPVGRSTGRPSAARSGSAADGPSSPASVYAADKAIHRSG